PLSCPLSMDHLRQLRTDDPDGPAGKASQGWPVALAGALAVSLGSLLPDQQLWSLAGLLSCYFAAIPFIHQTILADLAGTAVLFGSEAILERAYRLLPARGAWLQPVESSPAA